MNNQYIITEYNSDDYDDLITLWQVTGLGDVKRHDDQEVIKRTLEMGGKLLIMKSTAENKIIGSSWMTTDGRRLYLHHFGILPGYQGKGLGKKLMDESIKFAKELGQQFKLEVHENNEKAIELYKKYGFKYLGDYHVYIIRELNNT